MEKKRGSFSGGLGFVLAAAGSAVGLGNLWRFPYLAAQHGGGIFILVYIILALTFGFALMTTEIAIGRKTKSSPLVAFQKLSKKFSFVGYLAMIVPIIILPYYCVIGGWILKYIVVYLQGLTVEAATDSFFGAFIGDTFPPLFFFLVFLILTAVVVIGGVEKGIEKFSKVLMPILLIMIIGICIFILFIPGTLDGVKYYFIPNFKDFSFMTVCAAMGQLFFSLSIAMGIMVTYGSYMKDDVNMVKSVNQIEIFDTIIAVLAGLMVIPIVFAFSGKDGLSASGPGLMFVSLPKIFAQMAGGRIFGVIFFVLVLFAAVTSAVSIMEAIVSSMMDRFKITRGRACAITLLLSILLGVPSSMGNGAWANIKIIGMDFLTFFDYLSNSVLMPIVALGTSVLVGWVIGTKAIKDEVTKNGEKFGREKIYDFMIKYAAPVLLLIILVVYSLAQFGVISM